MSLSAGRASYSEDSGLEACIWAAIQVLQAAPWRQGLRDTGERT
jgi:hypothetical protein